MLKIEKIKQAMAFFTFAPLLISILLLGGCESTADLAQYFEGLYGPSIPKKRVLTEEENKVNKQNHRVSFYKEVKPILDARCVVCHGCYDAPCQLKLGSIEGINRGASKQKVYGETRFKAAEPTRLFIDAKNAAEWRSKNFFPILNEGSESAIANLDNSLLLQMLRLKQENPLAQRGKLANDIELDIDRDLHCPKRNEFASYEKEHPSWGMPYGYPGLTQKEDATIRQWLVEGAKVEPLPPLSSRTQALIAKWESFLNGTTLKEKLVFRYIYEHLFVGHLHFNELANNQFFRLVRSTTPPGQPITEIKTVRPYDDPGTSQFYYRLRPVTETIVDKVHFLYELNDQKMQRFKTLFFNEAYQVTQLPSYQPQEAANPFLTFAELPRTARYNFLLDDAAYFVSGFIKGPVCRGELATDSIRDRFWVVFRQPGHPVSQSLANINLEDANDLALPGMDGDEISLLGWMKYDKLGKEYLKKKDSLIDSLMKKDEGYGLQHIWNGNEGTNNNAALTIFRHFNSSTVVKGLIGKTPHTAWVVSYSQFERLHYLLVAGFNVYGTAGHLLASRTYMDILRQGAEDKFLSFMPAMERQAIYNSWYLGSKGLRQADPVFNIHHESQIKYRTRDYVTEFFDQVRAHLGKAAGEPDLINNCKNEACTRPNSIPLQLSVESDLRQLANLKGRDLAPLPELALLRVTTGNPNNDLVYTLVLNKMYSNISTMLFQDVRRLPEQDTLTVVPGILGSYPNFFFSVAHDMLGVFTQQIKNAKTKDDLEQLYTQFGFRRTSPQIWQLSDWFNKQHLKINGLEAGLLDMSRYENL